MLKFLLLMNYDLVHNFLIKIWLMINLVHIFRKFQLFKTVIKLGSYKIRVVNLLLRFQEQLVIHTETILEKYNFKII
jgi:hypothetical protein